MIAIYQLTNSGTKLVGRFTTEAAARVLQRVAQDSPASHIIIDSPEGTVSLPAHMFA